MELDGKYYTILNSSRTKREQIQYNVKEGEDLFKERCVVIKKKSSKDRNSEDRDSEDRDRLDIKKYYILVIRPTSVDKKYKRVKVRLIQSDYIVGERFNVRII